MTRKQTTEQAPKLQMPEYSVDSPEADFQSWIAGTHGPALVAIHPDATFTATRLSQPPTLTQLQQAVGGYIETVPSRRALAFCDEEGLLKGKAANPLAQALTSVPLVGDVAVLVKVKVARSGNFILEK